MTLYTTDYLEYYLTLCWPGWSAMASGTSRCQRRVRAAFVAIVIQEWLKARSEGADEGTKGVLSSMRIENRVWVAIMVILFAGIPFIRWISPRSFDTTRSAQCQVSVPPPTTRLGQCLHHARQPECAGAGVVVLSCIPSRRRSRAPR